MAIEFDQTALTGSIDNPQPVYVDNPNEAIDKNMATEEFQEAEVVDTKQATSSKVPEEFKI